MHQSSRDVHCNVFFAWSMQAMKAKVEGDYNASQVSAVTQGLDGTPVILIQVQPLQLHTHTHVLIYKL